MEVPLFLGAGMSVPYGMPTTVEFKDRMLRRYGRQRAWKRLLEDASLPDIEHVWAAVESFRGLSASPGGEYWAKDICSNWGMERHEVAELQAALEGEVFDAYRWNPRNDSLLKSILAPVLSLGSGQGGRQVFTTNYDRSVEECCVAAMHGVRCYDGFEYDPQSGRALWAGFAGRRGGHSQVDSPDTLSLHKMHGSLGWKTSRHGLERTAQEAKAADPNYGDFVIYPTITPKSHYEGTYGEIFDRFKEGLRASDACVSLGYSFRDVAIAEQFGRLVEDGKTLVAVGPDAVSNLNNVLRHTSFAEERKEWEQVGARHFVHARTGHAAIHAVQEAIHTETVHDTVRRIRRIISPQLNVPTGAAGRAVQRRNAAGVFQRGFAASRDKHGRPIRIRRW